MQDGLYLQPQASSVALSALYTSNKFVWQMKKTAVQAFQLKNSDGTCVLLNGDGKHKMYFFNSVGLAV